MHRAKEELVPLGPGPDSALLCPGSSFACLVVGNASQGALRPFDAQGREGRIRSSFSCARGMC